MENPFSHLEDHKLMELYKNGENMAFEVIYSKYQNQVYSYLNKRVSDKILIEDIFQSIFVKFHKSRHLYDNKYHLLKWIYTISRCEMLDILKKNKISFVELREDHLTTSPHDSGETIDLDSQKFLSEKEREALKLRYFSDEDFLEISKLLNTSEANSRKLVSRGLKKLKVKLIGEAK